MAMLKYREVKRDLFTVPDHFALVHCISADAKMGAGIAKTFRERYPHLPDEILSKGLEVGDAYYADEDDYEVINLITKEKYFHKPTYETMRKALLSLRQMTRALRIEYLAMPLIGCGLDRLEWTKVSKMIQDIFADDDIKIAVCKL